MEQPSYKQWLDKEIMVDKIAKVELAVVNELIKATSKHGPMHGAHEGYAVILEELDELWDEVKVNLNKFPLDSGTRDRQMSRMREEAIQVAAMAMRFVIDVCGGME